MIYKFIKMFKDIYNYYNYDNEDNKQQLEKIMELSINENLNTEKFFILDYNSFSLSTKKYEFKNRLFRIIEYNNCIIK